MATRRRNKLGTLALAGAPVLANVQAGTLLQNALGGLVSDDFFARGLIISDSAYRTVDAGFVVNAVVTDPVLSPARYRADVFDCDDYVFFLKVKLALLAAAHKLDEPLAVGCLLTRRHAFSFCLDPSQRVVIINTQSDDHAITSNPETFGDFLELSPQNPVRLVYL